MRKYYTLEEIIIGLRKEYQENQILLNELSKCIDVDVDFEVSKKINLSLKNKNYEDISTLYLKVFKRQSEIENFYLKIHDKIFSVDKFRNNGLFKIKEKNNLLSFERVPSMNNVEFLTKSILINDKDKFREIYEDIKKTKLFQLEKYFKGLNFYQSLFIDGDGICLSNRENINALSQSILYIKYQSDDDLINIRSKHRQDNYTINSLLNTKINVIDLPYDYLEILEKNEEEINKNNNLYLYDYNVKNDSFKIKDNDLVKVKKKDFRK